MVGAVKLNCKKIKCVVGPHLLDNNNLPGLGKKEGRLR